MVNPSIPLLPRTKADLPTVCWWLADSVGAIPIAAGIALAVEAHLAPTGNALWPSVLLLIGGSIRAIAIFHARRSGSEAAARAATVLRARLLPRLLPSRLMRARLIGEDMHLAVDAVAATEGQFSTFLPLRMASGLSPLIISLAVAPASWVASLIMLATLVPLIMGMVLAGTAAARQADEQHRALSRLSGLFIDRLRMLPTILVFSAEDRITRHLGTSAQEVARRTMTVLGIAFASSAILEFFAALSVALVAVYCGFSLLDLLPFPPPEHLTLTRAFFALALAPEFYLAMRRLAAAYHDKQQGEAALDAMTVEMAKVSPAPAFSSAPSAWSGRKVVVMHPEGPSIGPLDWNWSAPGLHVVTGATGAGKSSLLLALIGQIPIGSGAISIDGKPFVPGSLNPQIGWAGQQVALLPGTLRSNLAMGQADDSTMVGCLERMGLGPMLANRGGLDLAIDHRGSGLSGGERRRLGLARAILSNRPMLILDEPTADLDSGSAAAVRTILVEMSRTRMIIVASHDANVIAMAHTICAVAP